MFAQRNLRAAIALNNSGIFFMSRGSYKRAGETFKDAVNIMRFTTSALLAKSEEEQEQNISPFEASRLVDALLEKASHRMALDCQNRRTTKEGSSPRIEEQAFGPNVLTEDTCAEVAIKLVMSQDCSSSNFLFRLEHADGIDTITEDDSKVNLYSAMFLFNLATAINCQASIHDHQSNENWRLSNISMRLLEFCCTLLLEKPSFRGNRCLRILVPDTEDDYTVPFIIFVVKRYLEQASILGMSTQVAPYTLFLTKLISNFLEVESFLPRVHHNAASAA